MYQSRNQKNLEMLALKMPVQVVLPSLLVVSKRQIKLAKEESKEPTVKTEAVIEDTSKVATSKSAGGKQKGNKTKSKADK